MVAHSYSRGCILFSLHVDHNEEPSPVWRCLTLFGRSDGVVRESPVLLMRTVGYSERTVCKDGDAVARVAILTFFANSARWAAVL